MTGHFYTGGRWGGGGGWVGGGGGRGVYRPALRSVTRGWGSVKFSGKKRYVTLEWPLMLIVEFEESFVNKIYIYIILCQAFDEQFMSYRQYFLCSLFIGVET